MGNLSTYKKTIKLTNGDRVRIEHIIKDNPFAGIFVWCFHKHKVKSFYFNQISGGNVTTEEFLNDFINGELFSSCSPYHKGEVARA